MRTIFALLTLALATTVSAQSQDECRQKMQQAAERGIITDMNVNSRGLSLTVDERTWRTVNYDTKMGIVETASCMVTENEGDQARIVVRSNMTNEVLGEGYPYNFEVQ